MCAKSQDPYFMCPSLSSTCLKLHSWNFSFCCSHFKNRFCESECSLVPSWRWKMPKANVNYSPKIVVLFFSFWSYLPLILQGILPTPHPFSIPNISSRFLLISRFSLLSLAQLISFLGSSLIISVVWWKIQFLLNTLLLY